MKFEHLGCILHKRWIRGTDKNIIIGYWAEDFSEYYIDTPPQLRDEIINIQNCLSNIYNKIEKTNRDLNNLKNKLNEIFSI